jgi:SNF2 family DNA or RNA helicase
MRDRITTYSQLASEYPTKTALRKLSEKYGSDDISYHRELDKILGPLFHIKWYRIILDEAQGIKTAGSRSTLQCILITLTIFQATNSFFFYH